MNIEIIYVRDPVWSNATNTQIDCTILTSAYSEEIPFTASPNDPEAHGREIFRRCISGEFGEIRPYTPLRHTKHDDTQFVQPRWISAWPEVHDFIREANAENARNSSRAIGLVWGSMLETMFNNFIENQLNLQQRGINSLQYKNKKKCGDTFEARINGAFSEEMIDFNLRDHLHAIRRIRNACAHEWRLNYDNQNVKKLAVYFEILKSAYNPGFQLNDFESLIKMVFSPSCGQIIIHFAEIIVNGRD